MSNLPVACIFGAKNAIILSPNCPAFEAREMDQRHYQTDDNLYAVLAKERPSVIVSFGNKEHFKNLMTAPQFIRRMWLHFDNTADMGQIGHQVFNCFFGNAVFPQKHLPLVSVFTPAFRSGDKIDKPFRSLLAQTYKDWEWVIVDDSDDDGATFKRLSELAEQDCRVRVYKERKSSGNIGTVKHTACGLARGDFFVELDHDDELTSDALQLVVDAFKSHPEAGFAYSDFAECFEDGGQWTYAPGWGMGYGSYREEIHGGIKYQVVNSPHINAKTIRHIVAAPNHLRAWRKTLYDAIGGHRDNMHVADDYELMVRTFLATRMVHIPRLAYIQYRNMDGTGNTHQLRNKDIQRLVRYISMSQDSSIHRRLLELGVDDFVWKDGETTFFNMMNIPNPAVESHCTITYHQTV